jgi:cysteinyl-tRNA synthetase
MLAGARMAKSAGNFFRLTELEERGFDPLAFRYLALQAKYRTKLNFSTEGLAGADRALRQLRERVADWSGDNHGDLQNDSGAASYENGFREALADDLDLPAVMALVAKLTRSDLAPAGKDRCCEHGTRSWVSTSIAHTQPFHCPTARQPCWRHGGQRARRRTSPRQIGCAMSWRPSA